MMKRTIFAAVAISALMTSAIALAGIGSTVFIESAKANESEVQGMAAANTGGCSGQNWPHINQSCLTRVDDISATVEISRIVF